MEIIVLSNQTHSVSLSSEIVFTLSVLRSNLSGFSLRREIELFHRTVVFFMRKCITRDLITYKISFFSFFLSSSFSIN